MSESGVVGVIVDASSEERHIAVIESALVPTDRAGVPGEVIPADRASTGRAVEIGGALVLALALGAGSALGPELLRRRRPLRPAGTLL